MTMRRSTPLSPKPRLGSIPIPDVAQQLAEAFEDRDWQAAASYADELLGAVADTPDEVVATAHPLGFVHLLVWQHEDGSRLRLHLWPPEPFSPQLPAWPVHQHAWPLKSLVVRGRIRDARYAVIDDPAGDHYLYATSYERDRSVLRSTSRAIRCELTDTSVWIHGSLYEVPPNAFHTSDAETPSVTVVKSGVPTGRPSLVVGVAGTQHEVAYERRQLGAQELVRVVAGTMSS
jgi:hypothetical protein